MRERGSWARGFLITVAALALATPAAAQSADGEPEEVRWELYGYFKGDVATDSSLVNSGNFARWVEPESLAGDHVHFNLTARQTRFGLRVDAPLQEGPRVSGRAEIDFYGGGAENKNVLMLRHAYIDVRWPEAGWRLLAGQTSDVISPLAPRTVNYTVAWWVGNIGYRRPQVRVERSFDAGGGEILAAVAASRTIGDNFADEPGDSGVDSGRPTLQGRLGYSWGTGAGRGGIGLSGHWGEENLGHDFGVHGLDFVSWSANVDVQLPLGARTVVEAEAWSGENLDDYLGGIAQGVNVPGSTAIRAHGGWLSVEHRASRRLALSVGAGLDDPDQRDLAPGSRSFNRAIWGNAFFDVRPDLQVAVELSHWRTEYVGRSAGTGFRGQAALIFSF